MKIEIEMVMPAPMVGNGFRTGIWHYKIDGKQAKIFASIPAELNLIEQEEMLREKIMRTIIKCKTEVK